MHFNILSVVALGIAAASVPNAFASPSNCKSPSFKNLVVFGDSFSDTGNVYKLSNKAWPLSFYDHGRFSNGPIWTEHVARVKKYRLINYAYAAATSDSTLVQGYSGADSTLAVPGFTQQIDSYAVKSNLKDAANSLFLVNFQGNDFFFNAALDPATVLGKLHEGIDRLVTLGAKNILLVENIDYGAIPYFNTNATLAGLFGSIASTQQKDYITLESALATKYGAPATKSHPFSQCHSSAAKVNIGYLHLGEVFQHLQEPSQLKRLGITDVIHGCVSNDYKQVCKDASKYFYWDAFHPTTRIHKEIADVVLHIL
ncbi:hypothetical protein BGZ98_007585 [Dissophora globulifera]|nr:hypothetical protein BGZ98_007585 [Dissophora globulifera]